MKKTSEINVTGMFADAIHNMEELPWWGVAKNDHVKAFYESPEWRRLRYDVLKASGGCCELCGVKPGDRPSIVLNVDHIQPLRMNWDRRLSKDNLQVLCNECNQGKGNRDETDWRS